MTCDRTVHLVLSGAFAREVAVPLRSELIGAGYRVSLTRSRPEAACTVLVADHDDPIVDGFADKSRADGLPSLTVVHHHPDVRIGPMDVPGTTLCATCFTTRVRQHDPAAATSDRAEMPDRDLAVCVDGFPPYLVELVVVLLVDRLEAMADPGPDRQNEITVVNTATLVTRTFPVIPVNECPACSDQKPIGVLSGGEPMFPDLDGVPR